MNEQNRTGLCHIEQWSPTFLAPGTGFMEDSFSMDWGWGCRGDGSGGNVSEGGEMERQVKVPASPLLTSCCAARFLTGCGPVLVHGPGVGDTWYRG